MLARTLKFTDTEFSHHSKRGCKALPVAVVGKPARACEPVETSRSSKDFGRLLGSIQADLGRQVEPDLLDTGLVNFFLFFFSFPSLFSGTGPLDVTAICK